MELRNKPLVCDMSKIEDVYLVEPEDEIFNVRLNEVDGVLGQLAVRYALYTEYIMPAWWGYRANAKYEDL